MTEKNRKGGLRQAAGPGERLRTAVMRGSAALPVVCRQSPHRTTAPLPRTARLPVARPRNAAGTADPPPRFAPAPAPASPARYHAAAPDLTLRQTPPLTSATATRYRPFRFPPAQCALRSDPLSGPDKPRRSDDPDLAPLPPAPNNNITTRSPQSSTLTPTAPHSPYPKPPTPPYTPQLPSPLYPPNPQRSAAATSAPAARRTRSRIPRPPATWPRRPRWAGTTRRSS